MFDRAQLEQLAQKKQTTWDNVAREYCQHLFLSHFYQEQNRQQADKILFKGGTALRIVYQSPRFSEDLDFSGYGVGLTEIEDLVLETLDSLKKYQLKIDIHDTGQVAGGWLGFIAFQLTRKPIEVKVKVSLREVKEQVKGEVQVIADEYIPNYQLMIVPQEKLVQGKLNALLDRAKARDWFDLYFMLRARLIAVEQCQVLTQVKERLEQSQPDFERNLKPFLPFSHQRIAADFNQVLSRELTRFVG